MRISLILSFLLFPGCRETDGSKDTGTVDTGVVDTTDADQDGFNATDDCDDLDAASYPGAPEACDGVDNDCDGEVDENVLSTWYADADGDGFGDPNTNTDECDPGQGFIDNSGDCNDLDAAVFPGAEETCDGADNDCDGGIDEADATDVVTWYADTDGDGWGTDSDTETACYAPAGYAINSGDCDDTNPSFHPGALEADCTDSNDYNCDGSVGYADTDSDGHPACEDCDDDNGAVNVDAQEVCNGLDDDCNGFTDSEDPGVSDASTWHGDSDGDGYGGTQYSQTACEQPSGFVDNTTDCNDLNADSHPGASEICDEEDNDCDTEIDEGVENTWYADTDGDGYGDATSSLQACNQPPGYSTNGNDCDDAVATNNPGAWEICDSADNDCDGDIDEASAIDTDTYYLDADNDGYGVASSTQDACTTPSGYSSTAGDCNDSDAGVSPAADEICDTIDNDCDGSTDEASAVNATTWYVDGDSDGYGAGTDTTVACSQPGGQVANNTDCNDADASISPGASELCDAIDNDCDTTIDEDDAADASTFYADADTDGFGDPAASTTACSLPTGYVTDGTDCNDTDNAVSPNGVEVCGDGIDNDCSGDADGSDATDASTFYPDSDSDGFGDPNNPISACTQPTNTILDGTDCDDSLTDVNTSGVEVCGDGIDNDCSGDADGSDATDTSTFYEDADSDTFGNANSTTQACSAPSGFVTDSSDCDDTNSASQSCASCLDWQTYNDQGSGTYTIDPAGTGGFSVYCDMATDNGGWSLLFAAAASDTTYHVGFDGWWSSGNTNGLVDPAGTGKSEAYDTVAFDEIRMKADYETSTIIATADQTFSDMPTAVGSKITTCSGLDGVARHQFASDSRTGGYFLNDYIAIVACDTDGADLEQDGDTYDAAIFTTNLNNGDYRENWGDVGSEAWVGGKNGHATSDSSNHISVWVR